MAGYLSDAGPTAGRRARYSSASAIASLDARDGYEPWAAGFAVFGQVVEGVEIVRRGDHGGNGPDAIIGNVGTSRLSVGFEGAGVGIPTTSPLLHRVFSKAD